MRPWGHVQCEGNIICKGGVIHTYLSDLEFDPGASERSSGRGTGGRHAGLYSYCTRPLPRGPGTVSPVRDEVCKAL